MVTRDRARVLLVTAIAKAPGFVEAQSDLATLYHHGGEKEKAKRRKIPPYIGREMARQ